MGNETIYSTQNKEHPLSGKALVELMKGVLEKGLLFRFQAGGLSMSPFIREGDIITVSPLSGKKPVLGEVVAFLYPGRNGLAVHRVIGKKGSCYAIQGDNLTLLQDRSIPRENILGRITAVERKGRRVSIGLGPERYALAFLSRLGILVPIISLVRSCLRPFKERSEKETV